MNYSLDSVVKRVNETLIYSDLYVELSSDNCDIQIRDINIIIRNRLIRCFREIVCVSTRAACDKCDIAESCIYNQYFNNMVKPFSLNNFELEVGSDKTYISFNVKLFGEASKHKSFFIFALMRMGAKGLFKERAVFELGCIYDTPENEILHGELAEEDIKKLEFRGDKLEGSNVKLSLNTPFRIEKDKILISLTSHDILNAIKNRALLLDSKFNIIKDKSYFLNLLSMTELIEVEKRLRWCSFKRRLDFNRDYTEVGGYKGYIILSHIREETLQLLQTGQVLNIGIGTTFGLGNISYQFI